MLPPDRGLHLTSRAVIGPPRGAAENLGPAAPRRRARWAAAGSSRSLPLLLPAIIESAGTALAVALGGAAPYSPAVINLPLEVVDGLSSGFATAASANALILAVLAAAFLLAGQSIGDHRMVSGDASVPGCRSLAVVLIPMLATVVVATSVSHRGPFTGGDVSWLALGRARPDALRGAWVGLV